MVPEIGRQSSSADPAKLARARALAAAETMALSVTRDLPSEIGLHVLRRLCCWDLVAACHASAVWDGIVRSEDLWRRACEYRWPRRFHFAPLVRNDLDAGGAPPLVMPPWARQRDADAALEARNGRSSLFSNAPSPRRGGEPTPPPVELIDVPSHPKLLPPPQSDACAPPQAHHTQTAAVACTSSNSSHTAPYTDAARPSAKLTHRTNEYSACPDLSCTRAPESNLPPCSQSETTCPRAYPPFPPPPPLARTQSGARTTFSWTSPKR